MPPIPRLHLVTNDAILLSPDFVGQVERLLGHAGPAIALHLRGYGLTGGQLWARAERCAEVARRSGAWLVVNDRVDVALGCGARAVQLGRRSLPIEAVRRLLGERALIGASVHDPEQLAAARAGGADFMVAGTVYGTPSHPGIVPSGVPWVAEVAREGVPVIAIGGITAARVAEVRQAGAYGVAAIRAIWQAADPRAAIDELLKALV